MKTLLKTMVALVLSNCLLAHAAESVLSHVSVTRIGGKAKKANPKTADYNEDYKTVRSLRGTASEDKDCNHSSSESEKTICKIDVFVHVDPNAAPKDGLYSCDADVTQFVHATLGTHTLIQWKIKPMYKKDSVDYSFMTDWKAVKAVLLTDEDAFSHYKDSDDKKKVVDWTPETPVKTIYYFILAKWTYGAQTGICQIIDPVIANDDPNG